MNVKRRDFGNLTSCILRSDLYLEDRNGTFLRKVGRHLPEFQRHNQEDRNLKLQVLSSFNVNSRVMYRVLNYGLKNFSNGCLCVLQTNSAILNCDVCKLKAILPTAHKCCGWQVSLRNHSKTLRSTSW